MLLDGRLTSVSLTTVEVQTDVGAGTHLIFTEHGRSLTASKTPPSASTAQAC